MRMHTCCEYNPMQASCAAAKTRPHAIGEICFLDSSVPFSSSFPRFLTLSNHLGPLLLCPRHGKHPSFSFSISFSFLLKMKGSEV